MAKVKLPKITRIIETTDNPTKDNKWSQIHPSSILAYLGLRGWGYNGGTAGENIVKNGVPLLCYIDVHKNYYANKQEENYYAIFPTYTDIKTTDTLVWGSDAPKFSLTGGDLTTEENYSDYIKAPENYWLSFNVPNGKVLSVAKLVNDGIFRPKDTQGKLTLTATGKTSEIGKGFIRLQRSNGLGLTKHKLTEVDDLREYILAQGKKEIKFNGITTGGSTYIAKVLGRGNDSKLNTVNPNSGLLLKTHQSDIFNNWINTEWIDGENGISAVTAVDTSGGEFTIDTLNLAKKVYDMLNRIAVSGGTYQDWIETVYTSDYQIHPETPVYEGGMSCEIDFEEVVSNSATAEQPLGTLAGRGIASKDHKGGSLHIKVGEACYIMGIVSITPRVDYSQGNDFDIELETMNDLHKPALDGIGFQDLTTNKMAWWKPKTEAIGKQPAWIDYMTNFNKVYGNFAVEDNEAFMVLNRLYSPENDDYKSGALNYTTYINPEDFIYTFAERSYESQDFWVQLGFGIEARRVMSAKQIPNL